MDEEDPTQDIPDWLQSFRANLEDLETYVSAHPSERKISDSEEDAPKVVTQKRKHSIYTHFPQDRNYNVRFQPKLRGFRAEVAMRDLFHEQRSLVTW